MQVGSLGVARRRRVSGEHDRLTGGWFEVDDDEMRGREKGRSVCRVLRWPWPWMDVGVKKAEDQAKQWADDASPDGAIVTSRPSRSHQFQVTNHH